jgi:hypothetical protein
MPCAERWTREVAGHHRPEMRYDWGWIRTSSSSLSISASSSTETSPGSWMVPRAASIAPPEPTHSRALCVKRNLTQVKSQAKLSSKGVKE